MTDFSSPPSPPRGALATPEAPVGDPIPDPGLPVAPRRPASEARQRVIRRAAGMVAAAAVLVVFAVAVAAGLSIGTGGGDAGVGDAQPFNLSFGLPLGLAFMLMGAGIAYWSRTLAPGTEVVEQRTPRASEDAGGWALEASGSGARRSRFGRRRLIRNSLLGALALLPLPAVAALRRVEPAPGGERTAWATGVRLLTDPSYRPIRASELEVGELVSVVPESLLELPEQGSARKNERARSPVVVVRMRPDEISPAQGRENWHVDGVVAYSKICTHVGCPVSLYERTTHHLLCPCHQATFDLADSGAVVFGPATRPLPQLPLAVDDAGYLVAQGDFTEPVGPRHWELEA